MWVWERNTKNCYYWYHGGDRYIQRPTSSCFFDGSIDTQFLVRGPTNLLRADVYTRWLLSDWLTAWLPRIKKLLHYIFFLYAHTFFPSSSIHVIHFRCPLLTQYPVLKCTISVLSKVYMQKIGREASSVFIQELGWKKGEWSKQTWGILFGKI